MPPKPWSRLQACRLQLLDHSQILVGNKCDIDESKRAVPYSKGQALANEFGIKFFETSAKSNINVEEVSVPEPAVE